MGNVNADDARKVFEILQQQIEESDSLSSLSPMEVRARQLKTGSWIAKLQLLSKIEVNSCVMNMYQDQPGSIRDAFVHHLLLMTMEDPLDHFLRTEQQLGYDVDCSSESTGNIKCLVIQLITPAHEHSVEEVEQKISEFLISFADTLKIMSTSDFQDYIESLKDFLKPSDTSITDKLLRYWSQIYANTYLFGRAEHMEMISKITLEDVQQLFHRMTSPESESFRKVSIQVDASPSTEPITKLTLEDVLRRDLRDFVQCSAPPENTRGHNYISDLFEYRDSLKLYPAHKFVNGV